MAISPPLDVTVEAEDGLVIKKRATQVATAISPPMDVTAVAAEGVVVNKKQQAQNNTLREALLDHALRALPPPVDSRILCEGGIGYYDPYDIDFFLYRRAVPPWDTVWETRPLVLHDRRLVEALDALMTWPWPWYLTDEPRDQIEAVTRILGYHPGPVSSFRFHSSLCPDTEVLEYWMDVLSQKGVAELVLFDLYGDTSNRFPLHRLKTDRLTILALGFFHLGAEELSDPIWCDGVSSLVMLSLTGCSFSVSDLSGAVSKLWCLRTLTVASSNLALAGRGSTGRHEDGDGLVIVSLSLKQLRIWKCSGNKLTVEYAPVLRYLEIGISLPRPPAAGGKVAIVIREAAALRELHAVALRLHAIEIHGGKGPAFKWKKRESLLNLTTLGLAVHMGLPGQAESFVDLLSLLPALSELTVLRVDDLPASGSDDVSVARWWYLGPVPKWLKSSLQKLIIRDYRGGIAELALLTSLLQAAGNLMSLSLYPHASNVSPMEEIRAPIQALPRASKQCCLSIVSAQDSSAA